MKGELRGAVSEAAGPQAPAAAITAPSSDAGGRASGVGRRGFQLLGAQAPIRSGRSGQASLIHGMRGYLLKQPEGRPCSPNPEAGGSREGQVVRRAGHGGLSPEVYPSWKGWTVSLRAEKRVSLRATAGPVL